VNAIPLDRLPGFRRRFRVTPGKDWVKTEVEDDYHCMSLTLRHENGTVTAVEPAMQRAPWTTCPGAVEQLQQTFTGVALKDFVARGEKTANCTHLHDLALLGAAHAGDAQTLVYDILVSDPVEGRCRAELRRDGATALAWTHAGFKLLDPPELAGQSFEQLGAWIKTLDAAGQEAARLLRWGSILAHGRSRPMDQQSDARRLPVGSCYTFQPQRAAQARRIVAVRDFSRGGPQPLDPINQVHQAMDRRTAS
jgi:hypothetical protein